MFPPPFVSSTSLSSLPPYHLLLSHLSLPLSSTSLSSLSPPIIYFSLISPSLLSTSLSSTPLSSLSISSISLSSLPLTPTSLSPTSLSLPLPLLRPPLSSPTHLPCLILNMDTGSSMYDHWWVFRGCIPALQCGWHSILPDGARQWQGLQGCITAQPHSRPAIQGIHCHISLIVHSCTHRLHPVFSPVSYISLTSLGLCWSNGGAG